MPLSQAVGHTRLFLSHRSLTRIHPLRYRPTRPPSPFPMNFQEPITIPQSADEDFTFDFLPDITDTKVPVPLPVFGSRSIDIAIKREPQDFGYGDLSASTSPVMQARSMPSAAPVTGGTAFDITSLPVEQQAALAQLAASIFSYQSQYGLSSSAPPLSNTVQPSMVFSASPAQASSSGVSATRGSSMISPGLASSISSEPHRGRSADRPHVPSAASREASPDRHTRDGSILTTIEEGDVDARIARLVPLNNIFSAGKGKGGKKGGGVSSVVRGEDEDIDEADAWRPTKEEWDHMTSKEKRQHRNKQSARAFRERRKGYIEDLQVHLTDRDTVIDQIRAELVQSRSETKELKCVIFFDVVWLVLMPQTRTRRFEDEHHVDSPS